MDPDEEKKSSLFADLVEYREAISALEEFRAGFNVSIDRKWPTLGDPSYTVTITKRVSELKKFGRPQVAVKSDGNLLTAVRGAVAQLRTAIEKEAAERERGLRDAQVMGIDMSGSMVGQTGPQRLKTLGSEGNIEPGHLGIEPGTLVGPDADEFRAEYLPSQDQQGEDSRPSTGL